MILAVAVMQHTQTRNAQSTISIFLRNTPHTRRYVCMQKPFKRQPEFDAMLARVLQADPKGRLLLHGVAATGSQATMAQRLMPQADGGTRWVSMLM